MEIHVSQEKIDHGVQGSEFYCPIVVSIREKLPDVEFIQFHNNILAYYIEGKGFRYKAPPDACLWAEQFAVGVDVKPSTFEFTLIR